MRKLAQRKPGASQESNPEPSSVALSARVTESTGADRRTGASRTGCSVHPASLLGRGSVLSSTRDGELKAYLDQMNVTRVSSLFS